MFSCSSVCSVGNNGGGDDCGSNSRSCLSHFPQGCEIINNSRINGRWNDIWWHQYDSRAIIVFTPSSWINGVQSSNIQKCNSFTGQLSQTLSQEDSAICNMVRPCWRQLKQEQRSLFCQELHQLLWGQLRTKLQKQSTWIRQNEKAKLRPYVRIGFLN